VAVDVRKSVFERFRQLFDPKELIEVFNGPFTKSSKEGPQLLRGCHALGFYGTSVSRMKEGFKLSLSFKDLQMTTDTIERPAPDLDTLRASWKAHNQHSAYEMLQYHLLFALIKTNMLETEKPNFNAIGLRTLARLKKAFPPIVSINKLTNGRYPYDTLEHLLNWASRINTHVYPKPVKPLQLCGITLSEQAESNYRALAKWCCDELRMERKSK
jgi:hypothetical protein